MKWSCQQFLVQLLAHRRVLDETDKRRSLDFHELAISVEQLQHKVEKIALPQVRRRLLVKRRPSQAAAGKEKNDQETALAARKVL